MIHKKANNYEDLNEICGIRKVENTKVLGY